MAIPLHDNTGDIRLRSALVQRVTGSTFFVTDAYSLVPADCSAGCLLQPEEEDLVLIAEDSMGKTTIITVLEREAGKPAMVSVAGDLLVKGEGNLAFTGSRGLTLLTPKIFLKADRGRININNLTFAGKLLTACGRQLRSLYQSVETEAKVAVERVNRLYRRVQDEDAQLGSLHCQVQKEYAVQAEDCFFDAEKQMVLQSKKIEAG